MKTFEQYLLEAYSDPLAEDELETLWNTICNDIDEFLRAETDLKEFYHCSILRTTTLKEKNILLDLFVRIQMVDDDHGQKIISPSISGGYNYPSEIHIDIAASEKILLWMRNSSQTSLSKRVMTVLKHEINHVKRQADIKPEEVDYRMSHNAKYHSSGNKWNKDYIWNPWELDARITSMIHTFNALNETDKIQLSLERNIIKLMNLSGENTSFINAVKKSTKLRNYILSRLVREGIFKNENV